MSPIDQLSKIVVRLEFKDVADRTAIGTGFFYEIHANGNNFVPIIVTSKKNVLNSVSVSFNLTELDQKGDPVTSKLLAIKLVGTSIWKSHPDNSIDLCATTFGNILNGQLQGKKIAWAPIQNVLIPNALQLDELSFLEDVVVVGYPNGLWDRFNNMPLLQKGTTSTHPRLSFNGFGGFRIDIPETTGSLGSPVFHYRAGFNVVNSAKKRLAGRDGRFYFLGVLCSDSSNCEDLEIPKENLQGDVANLEREKKYNVTSLVLSSEFVRDFEQVFPKTS